MPDSTSPSARRGRPVSTASDDVTLVALKLFLSRGFDEVSMDDIAVASGVSRRTLFRHFPSKNALVWGDAEVLAERIATALTEAPPSSSLIEAITDAVEHALTLGDGELEIMRRRLELIAHSEPLRAYGIHSTEPTLQVLASFIAQRTGQEPVDLMPAAAASAITSAVWAALYWWADHGLGHPAEAAVTVLSAMTVDLD